MRPLHGSLSFDVISHRRSASVTDIRRAYGRLRDEDWRVQRLTIICAKQLAIRHRPTAQPATSGRGK